jgi:hypothetical protein
MTAALAGAAVFLEEKVICYEVMVWRFTMLTYVEFPHDPL